MVSRILSYIARNKNIVLQFIKRETISRYKGSYLGFLWTILTPIFMLCVYTFVFSEIFQARWHSGSTNKVEFAIIIFCGLSTMTVFTEVISRSPSMIISNTNYVKKVVFPLEMFPVIALGTALVNAVINFTLLIIANFLLLGMIHWTLLLLPIIILPLIFYTVGFSWILSSLGVYIRDIGQFIGVAVQALMLLSPIFYSVEVIPKQLLWFYQLNPATHFIDDVRQILLFGKIPALDGFLIQLLISGFICFVGLMWFRKTKHGFADVL
ncbi:ABC transporter permease [Paenibacillus sp. GCM10027626]|uniref:ABC transporter permease n=1 Tax=Paenibacillus sp. GCM10027626 TaxID=3273411 RepID=UPI00362CD737